MPVTATEKTEKPADGRGKSPGSRAAQFQKGNAGGKPRVKPERVDPAMLDDEAMLLAMRFVAVNDKANDTTELQKTARQWKEKKPDDFMTRLWELEAEAKKAALAAEMPAEIAGEDEVEETESDDELTEAIDELIKRHRKKARGEK